MKSLIYLITIISILALTGCSNDQPEPSKTKAYHDEVSKLLKIECTSAGDLPDIPLPRIPKKKRFKKGTSLKEAFLKQDKSIKHLRRELWVTRKNIASFNALKNNKH